MLKLGVNIDHVATLREARYRGRGFGEPNPVEAARICEAAGAHGITAHLREDRRHIQDRDVWELREKIETRLNLEMANAPEIIAIALKLSQAEYVSVVHGVPPILLIDDVMGELDAKRRAAFLPLLDRVQHARSQVFMTCTEENWPRELGRDLHRWDVRAGVLKAAE